MSEVSSPYANGTPSWIDLMASDREAAVDFYRAVFGWDTEVGPPESGFYTMCSLRGLHVAGIGEPPGGDQAGPFVWTTYFAVDDVDGTADKVRSAGGTVFMDPMDVMEQGRMAIAADPSGAAFGMWQAGKHFGAQLVNEPGALCWSELITRDPTSAGEFYQTVFGHGLKAMEGDFDYTELQVGGKTVGGMMPMEDFPPEVPSHWMTYFAVADTEAAVAKITEHGGAVVNGPFESQFGRIAVVRDPQGATFSVISMPTE